MAAFIGWLTFTEPVVAQADVYSEMSFRKISTSEMADFNRQFRNVEWTGLGFQQATALDRLPTIEFRARLQQKFGDPTRTLDDLIRRPGFRMAEAIQFEYIIIVDEKYPLLIMDVDGPFAGVILAGSPAFADFMPEVKRALTHQLVGLDELAEFEDVFFSPERRKWFRVQYKEGEFVNEEISRPSRFSNINLN